MTLATHEVWAEAYNGDKINDAVYSRNLKLEETYNCTISQSTVSDGSYITKIKDPLLAGDYVCDLLFGRADYNATLMQSNLLMDLATMENMDLSKAWYDDFSMNVITFDGKVFTAIGDGATLDDRAARLLYFNKGVVAEYAPDLDLYQTVREGKWTLDLLYEIMEGTASDLDGDGSMRVGTDRFGYIAESTADWYHVNACGVSLSVKNADGSYLIPDSPKQELVDAWAALRKVLANPLRDVKDSGTRFRSGLGTFFTCNAGTLLTMSAAPFEYGVLPMPKLNEDQDTYYTGVGGSSFCGYAIPVTASSDPEKHWQKNGFESGEEQSAYFLEAYSYYSMNILTPAFFDQVCLKQAVVDTDSQEMVILALKNKIVDPVVLFDWGSMKSLFSYCGNGGSNGGVGTEEYWDSFTSTYESRVSAARAGMESFLDSVRNAGL